MSAIDRKVRRDVIPRWRLSASKADLDALPAKPEGRPVSAGPQQDPRDLLRQYRVSRKPLYAAEALSAALTLGESEVAGEAAKLLSDIDLSTRPALSAQVESILRKSPELDPKDTNFGLLHRSRLQIQKYKRIIRGYPQNPLAWLDLAFAYAGIGQLDQAKNAVLAAVQIEPDHRGVVRAASRFFVHSGEFDRALSVINKSTLLKHDPWLVSAHIATARANGRSSALIGAGRKMFKNDSYRPDQVSELGAALATSEVEHGNQRLAQKLVGRALVQPTENAVAQVAWLESVSNSDFDAAESAAKLPRAWEARTFELFEKRDWQGSCDEARGWLCDQPFSSRPAVHGSYVAATFLEDYELSLAFAEAGYLANPSDVVVANNYAVALAETGRVEHARKVFDDASREMDAKWRWTLRATDGLINYREGKLDLARAAYAEARGKFEERADARSALLASVYQAREECRLGNIDEARQIITPLSSHLHDDMRFADHNALKRLAESLQKQLEPGA